MMWLLFVVAVMLLRCECWWLVYSMSGSIGSGGHFQGFKSQMSSPVKVAFFQRWRHRQIHLFTGACCNPINGPLSCSCAAAGRLCAASAGRSGVHHSDMLYCVLCSLCCHAPLWCELSAALDCYLPVRPAQCA